MVLNCKPLEVLRALAPAESVTLDTLRRSKVNKLPGLLKLRVTVVRVSADWPVFTETSGIAREKSSDDAGHKAVTVLE